jgi:nitrogen regulatory protein PII
MLKENLNAENMKVEAMSVFWGDRVRQVVKIVTVADVAGSLTGKGFNLPYDGGVLEVKFNTPLAQINVVIAEDATAVQVASALAIALQANANIKTAVVGPTGSEDEVTITLQDAGSAPVPFNIADNAAGFAYSIITQGKELVDIGYIEGDIEFSPIGEGGQVEVKAHQTGARVIGGIRIGGEVSLGFNFSEVSKEQMKERLFNAGASEITLSDSTTKVAGIGTEKDFLNVYSEAKQIVLHPRRLPLTDRSEDMCMWKAYPELGTMTFSGENLFVMPVSFKCFPDRAKERGFDLGVYGDWSDAKFF